MDVIISATRLIKVVLVGESGVGKTALTWRCTKPDSITERLLKKPAKPTIGIEFAKNVFFRNYSKRRTNKESLVALQVEFWDTAGRDDYRVVDPGCCFRGVHGILLVYDITQRSSFEALPKHLAQIRKYINNNASNIVAAPPVIVMLGNKADLARIRTTSYEEAKDFADRNKLHYVETSAYTTDGVDQVMSLMLREIWNKLQPAATAAATTTAAATGGCGCGCGGVTSTNNTRPPRVPSSSSSSLSIRVAEP